MSTRATVGRWRCAAAVLAATLALAGACSSSGDDGGAATSVAGDGSTTSSTVAASAIFQIPASRYDELAAAGLEFVEVDYPDQPDGVAWPTDGWPEGDLPDGVDADEVQAVVDRAFGELSDDTAYIQAIVVVQGGRLVVEAYNGVDPGEALNSWSMAKSITSALVGIQVLEGNIDIWAPAEVPEWSGADDPRHAITPDDLLRMSSGLAWNESYTDFDADVLQILTGPGRADRAAYVADKPLDHDPDTVWYYSTGTSNVLARLVADEVGYGDDLVQWIDEALFDKLGISTVEHDLDDVGVINGGSWINMTTLDFARFGLLYLRDGVWDGERILPEGWVDYSRMPTPTNAGGSYGAHWWIDDRPGAFEASGFDGQKILVVPDLDLVVAINSKVPDGRHNDLAADLVAAFEPAG